MRSITSSSMSISAIIGRAHIASFGITVQAAKVGSWSPAIPVRMRSWARNRRRRRLPNHDFVAACPEAFRLAKGGLVDRSTTLAFTLDGRPLSGLSGDTLASALLASGERVVGRSFKYHRPRGILTAGSEEPNALVELRSAARREPNTKATTIELYDGLDATTQNGWPSVNFDLRRLNSLFSPFIGAGFYYKTFMWPSAFWERVYEPLIRRAAGSVVPLEAPILTIMNTPMLSATC